MTRDGDPHHVTLNGSDLSLNDFVRAARDPEVEVRCSAEALEVVAIGRRQIDQIVRAYERTWETLNRKKNTTDVVPQVYGVTTGFGEFKGIPIPPDQLKLLQRNILLSHATGVGNDPNEETIANYLHAEIVRGALLLRLNAFLKGNSGVRLETVCYIQAMLNGGIIPLVPVRGSLGSSGDLCPLAHLFVTLLGEGRYYTVRSRADMDTSTAPHVLKSAAVDLEGDLRPYLADIPDGTSVAWPYEPLQKEGLALVNGAAFSAALLALAVYDAEVVATTADIAAALSFEAVCGRVRCLDPKIHDARSLGGQISSAANLRALVRGSQEVERAQEVQDVYSLRCAPQVHGATRDTIAFARMIIEGEINAATDNPLFFPGEKPWDLDFPAAQTKRNGRDEEAYSAGNFHGQPLALAADFLAIGVAELANISERRTQMLLDRHHNRNLPANLIPNRGVNSGLMLSQYCAASLVSENKVLTHPASVDSIPTSANTEDHVAMAMISARKLRDVVNNVQATLAIELLCAAQAIDWRVGAKRPLQAAPHGATDSVGCSQTAVKKAQEEAELFKKATAPGRRGEIAGRLGIGTAAAYLAVRGVVNTITEDCVLDGFIRRIWQIVRDGTLVAAVQGATGHAIQPIRPLCHPGHSDESS